MTNPSLQKLEDLPGIGRKIAQDLRAIDVKSPGDLKGRSLFICVNLRKHKAGKYAPSLPLAFRIARAFAVPLETVFQYQEAETSSSPTNGKS